ncbi:MAG: CopG family transcriptional regulator [Anaerolineaceae bacterium]|nr:CopG family transcriptional regulator [Anaerolineaceae bacterium]
MLEKFETVRTTLTLPADLIKRSQHFVDEGLIPSRNALIVAALEQYLLELERLEIDRQFEAMADDSTYQKMNEQLSESFAESDWDALVEAEIE